MNVGGVCVVLVTVCIGYCVNVGGVCVVLVTVGMGYCIDFDEL